MRHVIRDTRISSGQWPRCDVTNGTCGSRDFQGHMKKAPVKTYTCQNVRSKSYVILLATFVDRLSQVVVKFISDSPAI
jgi:hypothetical protein